jgi:hypothetical protein
MPPASVAPFEVVAPVLAPLPPSPVVEEPPPAGSVPVPLSLEQALAKLTALKIMTGQSA